LYDQASIPHLFQTFDLQIRVYMDTLANSINQSTLTGTPSCTIQSANLIAKITRHNAQMSNYLVQKIVRQPHHFQFTETRYGYFSLNAGSGPTVQLVLSSITGPVAYLMFTVRTSGVNLGEFNPGPIVSFAILDNSSTNIVGGQDVSAPLNQYIMSRDWTKSSYTTESIVQASSSGTYIYLYSFAKDPISVANHGHKETYYNFSGNEQLKITFPGTLAVNTQIDCYASVHSILQISPNSIKKVSI
jgi:hypothetical protein